jgi:hypothetical protein
MRPFQPLPLESGTSTLSDGGFDRDIAAMPLDDIFADREAHSCAGEFLAPMQALKHSEYSFEVLRFDAESVVLHRKYLLLRAVLPGRNMNSGYFGAPILDGIAEQILKQLRQLQLVGHHTRQGIVRYARPAFLDGTAKIDHRPTQGTLTRSGHEFSALRANTRVRQQILNQGLHAFGAIHREDDKFIRIVVQLALVASGNECHVAGHHPQRFLQVMRGNMGELLQILVGSLQFLHRPQEFNPGGSAHGDVAYCDRHENSAIAVEGTQHRRRE